jgi:hypothetical protein
LFNAKNVPDIKKSLKKLRFAFLPGRSLAILSDHEYSKIRCQTC